MFKPHLALLCALSVALLAACSALPKAAQEQTVTSSQSIRNVPVTVSYQGGVFYRVQVNNALPGTITLLWDESTYVTTKGESIRLLHVTSKYFLPQQAPARQTPSSIAPNSQFHADFTTDEWLDCARRDCTPQVKDSLKNARINLAFNIKGKRVTWHGEVAFAAPKQP